MKHSDLVRYAAEWLRSERGFRTILTEGSCSGPGAAQVAAAPMRRGMPMRAPKAPKVGGKAEFDRVFPKLPVRPR